MDVLDEGVEARYVVSGFRSLANFRIDLTRGLNVLVGSNGSGKTNFIEFLDFLSATILQNASTAVSRAGGVARVFSQEQPKGKDAKIRAVLDGIADFENSIESTDNRTIFSFGYELEVTFSRKQSIIFVSEEILKFGSLRSHAEQHICKKLMGSICVKRLPSSLEKQPDIKITQRLRNATSMRNPLRFASRYSIPSDGKSIRLETLQVGPDESMMISRSSPLAIDMIRSAITRGRSFNLIPEKVRAPDDLTRVPNIAQDGSGLTSTIYHLQRASSPPARLRIAPSRKFHSKALQEIVDWTRLVFPELSNLSVVADPHTGKYLGYLVIGSNGLRIPLQAASDGTLKWLALVTLIITRGGAYSIEEPENFLHPKMQQYLIDLIRDYGARPDRHGYFIISTHSETIINRCSPSELILFEFSDGVTQCSRLKNQDSVEEEINRTGFGLGYYYANNAVS